MTPRWIRDQIDYITGLSQEIPGDPSSTDAALRAGYTPDQSVFEEAADLVRSVGQVVVRTGWPEAADLYAASRTFAGACAPHQAIEYLARCLSVTLMHVPDEPEPIAKGKEPPGYMLRCYMQWKRVMTVKPGIPMMEAHRWYKYHMQEDGDEELPSPATWMRYVSAVRKYRGETREKSPRHGRPHSKSIVKQKDIEYARNG